MTPQEALQLIDQVLSGLSLSRADHQRLIEAITTLSKLINENNKKENQDA